MLRLGILGSTRGTHLGAIHQAIQQKVLPASIEIVISNKPDALILQKAKQLSLKASFIDPNSLSREIYDNKLSVFLKQHRVDWVILIGYLRILSNQFIADWKNKIINVHPSLLPRYAGNIDLAVHRLVLASGDKESGCTVHYVTEEVDAGPIILQKKCRVFSDDTPDGLKKRVQDLEAQALIEAILGLY